MAGVSTPALAAAVTRAGGLGALGLGASSVEQARKSIHQTRALTNGPFQVNVFCHAPAVPDPAREARWIEHLRPHFERFQAALPTTLKEIYPSFIGNQAMLQMLLEERPAVVSFHFGLPDPTWVQQFRAAGTITLATATSLAEAREIEAAGVDFIVAQGVEAGGHRGVFEPQEAADALGTFALVRLLSSHSHLPIIAAGGIMDGQGIRAALDLGAVGVQMGTAFILCPESSASAAYRAELSSEKAWHTGITAALSGRPARGIINEMHAVLAGADHPDDPLPDYPVAYDAAKQLHAAASRQGNHGYAAHWAGQGAPLARALPAGELVATLVQEWQAAYSR
ncbi:hypothetical protein GCM10008938_31480 [Deinococcus roseus]|uniref:Propionate 3-nitronate monooxygenase n=2 Tax=Deinococcus roseus TaxID=392414 RepID=A0ABQ2D3R4_9DEIO|nr:hypothetical protein GCM10008938_31480 [Deinococcus roseus]